MNNQEDVREPYRWPETGSGIGLGRLDVNGVEWWACDPYPTWYRWEDGELYTRWYDVETPAEWMQKDRRMAVWVALLQVEAAKKKLSKAQERMQIAQEALDSLNEEADHE